MWVNPYCRHPQQRPQTTRLRPHWSPCFWIPSPPRTDRPCGFRKSYECQHPVVKETGIFPQLTVLDTLKAWFMRTISFFGGTLWLCFGPWNKLAIINSLEEVVSPPHNSFFWGQWLCSVWWRGSLTKGTTEPTLIKHQCYQGTARHVGWSTLALWGL